MELILIAVVIVGLLFLLSQNQENQELISSVTELDRGNESERDLVLSLRKLDIHPDAIFHDLYVKKRNGTYAQIDLVLATSVGLIVFEVKEYSGWLFGSGNSTYWTQVLAYGKQKFRLYNPIRQNQRHIEELRKCSLQFSKMPMFSVVLFYGDCVFKKIHLIPQDVFIIKPHEIKRTIEYISSNNPLANYTNKREILQILKQSTINGGDDEIQQAHIEFVEQVKEQLGAKKGRIRKDWGFNLFPPEVRKTLRWLRNWR
jgi:hypothetical protein